MQHWGPWRDRWARCHHPSLAHGYEGGGQGGSHSQPHGRTVWGLKGILTIEAEQRGFSDVYEGLSLLPPASRAGGVVSRAGAEHPQGWAGSRGREQSTAPTICATPTHPNVAHHLSLQKVASSPRAGDGSRGHCWSTTGSALTHPGRRRGVNGGCPQPPSAHSRHHPWAGKQTASSAPALPLPPPLKTRGESPRISLTRAGQGCCCRSARETEAQQGVKVSVKVRLGGRWVQCPAPLLGAGAKKIPVTPPCRCRKSQGRTQEGSGKGTGKCLLEPARTLPRSPAPPSQEIRARDKY